MSSDKSLGLDRDISRRDFVNGAAAGASLLAAAGSSQAMAQAVRRATSPPPAPDPYPPRRDGLRGSHPGSFETAHLVRDGEKLDLGAAEKVDDVYDLIVVGGGLSGLAAAYFFLRDVGTDARVLILENHDDFGGHAKRNEFVVDGKMLAINGGTLNIESPERYNRWAKQVLDEIGVDVERYRTANKTNASLYSSLGLRGGYFFDKETWGRDKLVVNDPAATGAGRGRQPLTAAALARTPLTPKAQADFTRIYSADQPDYMPGMNSDEKKLALAKMSYQDYLLKVAKVDPQVYWFQRNQGTGSFCVGADATPALYASTSGAPGFSGLKLDPLPNGLFADLPGGQHGRQREGNGSVHFPDGNATVARLLVRWLLPDAIPGKTQEDMGVAHVDYSKLDNPGQRARIRLSSIVVNVRHDGEAHSAKEAVVTYANGGKLYSARGRAVVMACWNMVIPYIAPELPAAQKEALAYGVKGPMIYSSIAIKNWRAFEKLGISRVTCPTGYHDSVDLTEAADLGELHHARTPDEPIALHLTKFMTVPGLPRRDQHRAGRTELLATSFEDLERGTRDQLARILGPGGFDPARDIAAVTINRWPHGYAYTYNSLYDPIEWAFTQTDQRPCVIGRQRYGLITIANSDAAASPHTDAAMLEAHRAVSEVMEQRAYPFIR